MNNDIFLSCNCTASAYKISPEGDCTPVCIIHGTTEQVTPPNLEGRKAICSYGCHDSIVDSKLSLCFFEYKPDKMFDVFYCGCYGYD